MGQSAERVAQPDVPSRVFVDMRETSDRWFLIVLVVGTALVGGLALLVRLAPSSDASTQPRLELPEGKQSIRVGHFSSGRSPIVVMPATGETWPRRMEPPNHPLSPEALADLQTDVETAVTSANGVATLVEVHDCWNGQLWVRVVEELASPIQDRPVATTVHCTRQSKEAANPFMNRFDDMLVVGRRRSEDDFAVRISGCEVDFYALGDLLLVTNTGEAQEVDIDVWPLHPSAAAALGFSSLGDDVIVQ